MSLRTRRQVVVLIDMIFILALSTLYSQSVSSQSGLTHIDSKSSHSTSVRRASIRIEFERCSVDAFKPSETQQNKIEIVVLNCYSSPRHIKDKT